MAGWGGLHPFRGGGEGCQLPALVPCRPQVAPSEPQADLTAEAWPAAEVAHGRAGQDGGKGPPIRVSRGPGPARGIGEEEEVAGAQGQGWDEQEAAPCVSLGSE